MTYLHSSGLLRGIAVAGLSILGLAAISLGAGFTARPLLAQTPPQTSPQTPAQTSPQTPPQTSPQTPASESTQRLMQMFSPEIRATLGACEGKGQVSLAAGASAEGVTCGDGSVQSAIPLQTYLSTVSDFLTANLLLGMRERLATNPEFTAERMAMLLNTPEGTESFRNVIQSELLRSGMIAPNSDPTPLTEQIMSKLQTTVQRTDNLQTLFGTEAQYDQVVQNFCTAPGMPIEQAQQTVPDLSSPQFYAICVQESETSR